MKSSICDISLAGSGNEKIIWAGRFMPLLNRIGQRIGEEKPFQNLRIALSIHLEAKTARLAQVLKSGGADVFVTGCNPLSTQDDVAAALASQSICVNAVNKADEERYLRDLVETLRCSPHLIVDDGGDFVSLLHGECKDFAKDMMGGCEETTTGVHRLRVRQASGGLKFPMIAVNDAGCKHLFDNRYGTGQSVMAAIMHSTNLSVASRVFVVAGYGWCGKGISRRAAGMGARVIVTEIDAVRALEAVMDGFEVMPMGQAAKVGDVFITATGCCDILTKKHFHIMKDNALLCNAGHFDVEINLKDLAECSVDKKKSRSCIETYTTKSGCRLHLLAEGRLVNLAAGMGHPVEIMDLSFALQALCLEYLAKNHGALKNELYAVPGEIDRYVASEKTSSLGVKIDRLNKTQKEYIFGMH
jgi:adenosylhomocysteinase